MSSGIGGAFFSTPSWRLIDATLNKVPWALQRRLHRLTKGACQQTFLKQHNPTTRYQFLHYILLFDFVWPPEPSKILCLRVCNDHSRRHPLNCKMGKIMVHTALFWNAKVRNLTSTIKIEKKIVSLEVLFVRSLKAGFSTRCNLLWLCRYAKPSSVCRIKERITLSSKRPCFFRHLPTLPPGTYSKKILRALSVRW